jgi:hypothetical protein
MLRIALGAAFVCGTFACDEEEPPARSESPPEQAPPDSPEPAAFEGLRGFYELEKCRAILNRTQRIELTADTSSLTPAERAALAKLTEVGEIFGDLYEDSLHPDSLRVRDHLASHTPAENEREHLDALRDLYDLFDSPILSDLDGEKVPLAPVPGFDPRANLYPPGVDADALRAFAAANDDAGDILGTRTLVRRRTAESLAADRALLEEHPELEALHPGLRELLAREADPDAFYAVPYALAHAEPLERAKNLLFEAASLVQDDDADLADYLEQRARDLLTNDYEAGDAAWVRGRPHHINAILGAYETYDDTLLSVRAAYAASLLVRNSGGSDELRRAVENVQSFEDALPGGPYGRVQNDIPVDIYEIYADYGQSRGANTATILPNESHVARKYGRTILIRGNILMNPTLVGNARDRFRAAVVAEQADDYGDRGGFDRTVWHEVGHYLGPHRTADDRSIDDALTNLQNHFEEMKADLVSLWLMPRLRELGVIDDARLETAYAAGILRTLLTVEPQRTSPYQTMELMQQNYFFEHGLLTLEDGKIRIHYDRYPEVVASMLGEVLQIQRAGDHAQAEAFVDRYAKWDDTVQGVIGRAMEAAGGPRYTLVRYAALR